MNDYKFGNFIYELRSEKNISQEELGQIAGVSNSTVSKWENGKSIPPMKTLKILSSYFDISVEELLNGERKQAEGTVHAQPIIQQIYIPYSPPAEPPKSSVVRTLMILLFILTLFTPWIAMSITFRDINGLEAASHMWKFFLVIPLPLTSVILGIILLNKHYKVVKNVVAGFLMLFFLIIFGSLSFIFPDMNDPAYLSEVEQKVGFEFTDDFTINTIDFGEDGQEEESWYKLNFISMVEFEDNAETEKMAERIINSDKWMKNGNKKFAEIIPPIGVAQEASYTMIYNADLNTYNENPTNGVYHFYVINFTPEGLFMQILEYEAELDIDNQLIVSNEPAFSV